MRYAVSDRKRTELDKHSSHSPPNGAQHIVKDRFGGFGHSWIKKLLQIRKCGQDKAAAVGSNLARMLVATEHHGTDPSCLL